MKRSILIITPRPPYPLFSGGEHAQFYFIGEMMTRMDVSICFELNSSDYNSNIDDFKKLKEIWKDVTFYPMVNLDSQTNLIKLYRKIKNALSGIKQNLFKIINAQKPEEIGSIRYQSLVNQPFLLNKPDFVNHVASILNDNHFDIIQVEFIALAPLVYILPPESIKVLVHHELRYLRIRREVDLFEKIEPFDTCRLESIRDQELALLKRFDKIITLTENDKEILSRNIAPEKIYVSPATVREDLNQNTDFSPFINKLVFIGSSIHLPNKDAIKWFIDSVMPFIENRIPDLHLEIIGQWDKLIEKEYSRANVKFKGFIENLSEAFQASLLIIPVRIGSGMRLKIIEAINHHIPFITTTIGVEGLDFEDGRDCIIADAPEGFAEGIIRLSNNSSLQKEFVNNAASKLKEKYSFESAIKKRMDFYKNLD